MARNPQKWWGSVYRWTATTILYSLNQNPLATKMPWFYLPKSISFLNKHTKFLYFLLWAHKLLQSLFFFSWFSATVQRNESTGDLRIKPGGKGGDCIRRLLYSTHLILFDLHGCRFPISHFHSPIWEASYSRLTPQLKLSAITPILSTR